jgi:methionine sulfoxide reductase heme-binding subunit
VLDARTKERLRTHLGVGAVSVAGVVLVKLAYPDGVYGWSLGSAHAASVLLLCVLAIGPIRLLRGGHSPPHLDVRRDVGIWCGLWALLHSGVALFEHLGGRFWEYFFKADTLGHWHVRLDAFGVANILGLGATLLALLLLVLSADWALKRLGSARWKALQRLSYPYFALLGAHGVAFQLLSKQQTLWRGFLIGTLLVTALLQLLGVVTRLRQGPAGNRS